jgi:hypothetical protein
MSIENLYLPKDLHIQPEGLWKQESKNSAEEGEGKGLSAKVEYLVNRIYKTYPRWLSADILQHQYGRTDGTTPEEEEDFRRFVLYAAKRVLNATIEKETATNGSSNTLERLNRQYQEALSKDKVYAHHVDSVIGPMGKHDIAHVFGELVRGNTSSPVGPFLKFPENQENNDRDTIESELFAALLEASHWSAKEMLNPRMRSKKTEDYKGELSRGEKKELKKEDINFEEYVKVFVTHLLRVSVRNENKKTALKLVGGVSREDSMREKVRKHLRYLKHMKAYDAIADDLIANPPARLVECLRYVWDHQANPDGTANQRVLVDLFFDRMGPLLEKLRIREERLGKVE